MLSPSLLDLSGPWAFSLDPQNLGLANGWHSQTLTDSIQLPGSTDEAGYGEPLAKVDLHRFNRIRRYVGPAWYQRTVSIPDQWSGRRMVLFLERCLWETRLWVDDAYVGEGESLCTPHQLDVSAFLAPGKHRITLRVDNSPKFNIGIRSHAYSEDMQTIWNGITGRIELRASEVLSIGSVRVESTKSQARIRVKLVNTGADCRVVLSIRASLKNDPAESIPPLTAGVQAPCGESFHDLLLPMGEKVRLWSDLEPNLYELHVRAGDCEPATTSFGMRSFKAEGPQFKLNGRTVFLRGTHDGGCFPLTGYPSCNVEEWRRIYRILKSYGLNHMRFHSYCPPEAAFTAADEEGILLQTELPLFSISAPPIGSDRERDAFLHRELRRILEAYGNHPSFCMLAMGNELRGDYSLLSRWVAEGQGSDPRHLYCTSSNNGPEPSLRSLPVGSEDFLVSHARQIGGEWVLRRLEGCLSHPPETAGDYRQTLEGIRIPVVSHEVGQWQVYPDFTEIPLCTGTLRADNLEMFRESLEQNGLLGLAGSFVQASGKLSIELYREEIERSLRTPNYGGFQLLDIRDYHGQGTATVGWLNSFWNSKGLVEPGRFRQFCGPTVLLLRMARRTWRADQTFVAEAELANYGACALEIACQWSLRDPAGSIAAHGSFAPIQAPEGALSAIGSIAVDLSFVKTAGKFRLELQSGDLSNAWDLWIYPREIVAVPPGNCRITHVWDEATELALAEGTDVLLISTDADQSEAARFAPVFWNTQLFAGQEKSMGILCDPAHPLFRNFPTDFHANWQWWELMTGSRAIDLSTLPRGLDPLVRVIDHMVRNHSMALVFEARVGRGRLLCVSANLSADPCRPAARQFHAALLEYMASDEFDPAQEVALKALRDVLKPAPKSWLGANHLSLEADSCWWDGPVKHAVDGERVTLWKSGRDVPFPHEINAELREPTVVWGFLYQPRQDGNQEGMVRDYAFYVSPDGQEWGAPAAMGSFPNSLEQQIVRMELFDDGFNTTRSKPGRFIRFVALSSHNDGTVASVGNLDVMTEPPRGM